MFVACAVAASGLLAVSANAATIVTDASTVVTIPGLTAFTTLGDNMNGMAVTVNLVGGGTETVSWGTTGAGAGAAVGTGWSIAVSGDTFSPNAWTVDFGNLNVLSMVLDGSAGLTVFDRFEGAVGTPDSANGRDFSTDLLEDALVVATYSNIVAVSPNAPVGDIWHTLSVDFSGVTGGFVAGRFTFSQDADNDSRLTQVPEPATLGVLGLALAGLGLVRRRRAA